MRETPQPSENKRQSRTISNLQFQPFNHPLINSARNPNTAITPLVERFGARQNEHALFPFEHPRYCLPGEARQRGDFGHCVNLFPHAPLSKPRPQLDGQTAELCRCERLLDRERSNERAGTAVLFPRFPEAAMVENFDRGRGGNFHVRHLRVALLGLFVKLNLRRAMCQ